MVFNPSKCKDLKKDHLWKKLTTDDPGRENSDNTLPASQDFTDMDGTSDTQRFGSLCDTDCDAFAHSEASEYNEEAPPGSDWDSKILDESSRMSSHSHTVEDSFTHTQQENFYTFNTSDYLVGSELRLKKFDVTSTIKLNSLDYKETDDTSKEMPENTTVTIEARNSENIDKSTSESMEYHEDSDAQSHQSLINSAISTIEQCSAFSETSLDNDSNINDDNSKAFLQCINNCGFYRNPNTGMYCSSCYKVSLQNEPIKRHGNELEGNSEYSSSSNKKVKSNNSCTFCSKKVGLVSIVSFTCRCGNLYCSKHHHPEKHECTYDYKNSGRKQLSKSMMLIKTNKLERLSRKNQ